MGADALNSLKIFMDAIKKNEIKSAYDKCANQFAAQFFHELYKKPNDRKLLNLFAERTINRGKVLEIGCDPGEIANYLKMKDVDISGIDISDKMVETARRLNPVIEFNFGDVFNLKYDNDTSAGIVAFYLIVNFPKDDILSAFLEIKRVLIKNGIFFLSFHIPMDTKYARINDFLINDNPIDYYFHDPSDIKKFLTGFEFEILGDIIRSPYEGEITARSYIFARNIQ